jgi:hydrogenase-4 component B
MMDEIVRILLAAAGVFYLLAVTGALVVETKAHRYYFWSQITAIPAALVSGAAALLVLIGGARLAWNLPGPMEWITFSFQLDGLSAFFLFTLSLLALIVSVYSIGYRSHPTRSQAAFQPLFLLAMTGLLCASDVISFLFFWELMSFSSYFLIIVHHDEAEPRQAGMLYLIMTQAGTVFVMIGLLALAGLSQSVSFANLTGAGATAALKTWLLLAFLAGFGTKASIVPLHIWLPRAHPAAPAPVSALMSGFMIKAAIYGLLRFTGFLELDGWFGGVALVVGVLTAFFGILYAFVGSDLKKLLAYCSIENIGIILAAAGVYFWGLSLRNDLLIGLALAALELHVLNHALFKGLLFMSAGVVLESTGTRDLEQMGGLIRRMPATALFSLIGCLSGAALPFGSGFISEWLIFQSLFLAGRTAEGAGVKLLAFLAIGGLALTAGLAVATFVKLFGVAFLALPRSSGSESAREGNRWALVAMGLAAFFCLGLGFFPWLGLRLTQSSVWEAGVGNVFTPQPWLGVVTGNAAASPLVPALGIAVIVGVTLWLLRGRLAARTGPTWNCGTALQPRMEYTATAFAKMGRLTFRFLLRPQRRLSSRTGNRFFPGALEYRSELPLHWEDKLYRPLVQWLLDLSGRIRNLQAGSIKLYLGYIFAVLCLLLLYVRWGG